MSMIDFAAARTNMVEGQIRPNKVSDMAVVAAFLAVPREQYVPKALRSVAYVDEDIQIAPGRWLMEPMVLARMIQTAEIRPADTVLIIGPATGYSAAVIGRLATSVVCVEADGKLVDTATRTLSDAAVDNAVVLKGAHAEGWKDQAPYDVILIDGAVAEVPDTLKAQLAEGGRLVAVTTGTGKVGTARLYRNVGGVVSGRPIFDASVHVLPGFEAKPAFVF